MALWKSKEQDISVDMDRLPRHLAIIMDGNGRWAKKRGLPRTAGHSAGSETFRRIATLCGELGIDYLTVYAFSTENWKRPEEEVAAIMKLLKKYLQESLEELLVKNVRLRFFGDLTLLNDELREMCHKTEEISRNCTGITVNICLNYGGRDEITRAARLAAEACQRGELQPEEITESVLGSFLYSGDTPDVDLVIRPSGEIRISNFLLWQSAYAEFYFTDALWPDFDREELMKAFAAYQKRDRRFGGIKNG